MEKEISAKYVTAGLILSEAKNFAKKILVPGADIFECAEKIEEFILKKGGKPAFPVNLSFNENAAHQTPDWNEKIVLRKDDVLKVDIGVHIEGYIADCAFTVNYSEKYGKLIEAAEQALSNAFSILPNNPTIGEIGGRIEKIILEMGFKPVDNLTGHGLEQYLQHAPPSIPNIENRSKARLENGRAYAIEPFVSTGDGHVREGAKANIFCLQEIKAIRNVHSRKILGHVVENYKTLPFAERWLQRELKMSNFELKVGLKQLMHEKIIKAYPILHDLHGSYVAQAENSFIKMEKQIIPLVVENDGKAKGT
ncbi:MAG: type II methionyl aminopeptidase [Candidatus Diapherotrites archaeon]|nr:type II methionyl aminopeptidase [Candidatus Diapherotrites archaeon]